MDELSDLDDAVRESMTSWPCSINGCDSYASGLSIALDMENMEEVMNWIRYTKGSPTFTWKPRVVHVTYEENFVNAHIPMCYNHFQEWADEEDIESIDYTIKPDVILTLGIDY